MRKWITGILAICFSLVLRGQMHEIRLTGELDQASFEEFVRFVESRSDARLFYNPDWVRKIRVTTVMDSTLLEEVMTGVLKGSGLYFSLLPDHRLMILPERPLVTRLPENLMPEKEARSGSRSSTMGISGDAYLQGTRPEQITRTIIVGTRQKGSSRSVARIKGRFTDISTGEPVVGATMVIRETGKGAITDQAGIATIALSPGTYSAQFSFIGMEQVNVQLVVYSDGEFNMEMRPTVIAIKEVQIMGNQYRDINSTDVGVERLSMSSLKQVPVFMGEKDVIKISKLLPGITSAGEASSGVNVRGGNVDQNVFYVNRIPVYNTSHLFGFFSAFNSDIIRDFSIYKGNVPVEYGGRLSSVFNIMTRKGNKKQYTAHAGISPVSAHLTVEGPLRKDHSSILLSGRSSYSDWILNRMEDPLIRESKASFYDFAGSMSFQPNSDNQVNLFYYQSYDRFNYSNLSDYNYANRGGSVNWEHHISPAFTADFTAVYSQYRFGMVDKYEISNSYEHAYELQHNEVLAKFSWVPALNHRIDFGTNLILYRLDRGKVEPYGEASVRQSLDLGKENGLEGGVFVSDNITVAPWLSLYAGIRYSYYSMLGPKKVMLYAEGEPMIEENVVDSLRFGSREPVAFYSGPEVRTAANFKINPNTSLKLSLTQMRQYLFMLSNTVTISPTDQWKLSDYHIKPPASIQYTAGIYRILPRGGLSASMELYYKQASNIVEYRDGIDFISTPYIETTVLQGEQQAYGAEFMLQKSTGQLDGWISYAYSRSFMHVPGKNGQESINGGEPYPSNYDRPNVLNVVTNLHLNRRFTISGNLVYMTGRPVTFPSSLYYINDYAYIDFYARNQYRVPDYFRLDLSLSLEGNLKADKPFHSTWNLNVYNVLGRNNAQTIYFEPYEYFIMGYQFSVIGVPIVTLSWNVKLGNYESN